MPQKAFESSAVVKFCLPFLDGIVSVYTDDMSHDACRVKEHVTACMHSKPI